MTPSVLFHKFLPEFKSASYTPWRIHLDWGPPARDVVKFMYAYSPTRCQKRLDSYIIPGEFARSKGSLRFGVNKSGHGYNKERGDFCILAGYKKNTKLTVFYRSVELVAGLHFDYCIFDQIEKNMGPIKQIDIWAVSAFVFGLKGNSGQRLHKELSEFFA